MAKARRKRKSYTQAQRTSILAAAQKEGLTAMQVQRKFGVTPVTYYSWRKKGGITGRRGMVTRGRRTRGNGGTLSDHVRTEVRTKVREILPMIVRGEVSNYLDSLFSTGPGRRRRLS
jgi:transposase-like protein